MEESEALCTKMGIMVNGELKCLGSLQHLNAKYGKGYTLMAKLKSQRIDADKKSKTSEFISFVLSSFDDSKLKESRDGFVNIHISDNSTSALSRIFSLVEQIKNKYSIEYYIVTQTKLEQIFLDFAARQIGNDTLKGSKSIVSISAKEYENKYYV